MILQRQCIPALHTEFHIRGHGGIGRRARFRFWCHRRAGSSPVARIQKSSGKQSILRICATKKPCSSGPFVYLAGSCGILCCRTLPVLFHGLFAQCSILEVIDLHGVAYIGQSLCSSCLCTLAALCQNVVNIRKTLLPVFSALTDRSQLSLDHIV